LLSPPSPEAQLVLRGAWLTNLALLLVLVALEGLARML
jgi:hypothetical protein